MSDTPTFSASSHVKAPSSGHRNQSDKTPPADSVHRRNAATIIQKHYRGYRSRREMKGIGLDAATRWDEAVKEATYRQRTRPLSRKQQSLDPRRNAIENWKRIGEIARHAGSDDTSDTSGEEGMTSEELADYKRNKAEARAEIEKSAKMMDLQYWLEMVDKKHRYGSNLRTYHRYWKQADTQENFFYWLDKGEGKVVELPNVSRKRLESEQVRYLSREERQQYLVRVDSEGRLCWAKNGQRISTTADYRDSVEGIVVHASKSPTWSSHEPEEAARGPRTSRSNSALSTSPGSASDPAGEHYINHDLQKAKGLEKLKLVSPATLLNQLLQRTVRPGTWIFVADTSFRLYVGIKQSGAFQHSSFLNGARISAAGLIKIKHGHLHKLSPLSGHYRPPTKNFKLFVHSLRDAHVDMSRVSISRSYAVLVGLEAYVRTRKKIKRGIGHVDKLLHPEDVKKREEAERDKSKSAEREREILALEQKRLEQERANMPLPERVLQHKIHAREQPLKSAENSVPPDVKSAPHEDVESGIPPDGKR